MITQCGKKTNSKGKPFTLQGLRDHTRTCPKCIEAMGGMLWVGKDGTLHGRRFRIVNEEREYVGTVPEYDGSFHNDFDDLPDGAFWSIGMEIGG